MENLLNLKSEQMYFMMDWLFKHFSQVTVSKIKYTFSLQQKEPKSKSVLHGLESLSHLSVLLRANFKRSYFYDLICHLLLSLWFLLDRNLE